MPTPTFEAAVSPAADDACDIRDLVDIAQLRQLFEQFTLATGFTIGFLDHPGMNILIAAGWKRICRDFHRGCAHAAAQCSQSNQQLLQNLGDASQTVIQVCQHGMVDCAIPIRVNGRHLASLTTGQILLDSPDLARFSQQAQTFGFDRSDYLQALAEVEIVDAQKLKYVNDYLAALAQMIAQMATARLKLNQEMAQRKRTEAEMRIAAIAFESQEGIVITDAAGSILRVNQSFCDITGYTADEAVGQTMKLLQSGRHDVAFFTAMRQCLAHSGAWQGEIWNKRKNGEIHPEWLIITAVRDEAGQLANYVATLTDITFRQAAEYKIRKLAFYDPLTGLPNRRLLLERLQQALAGSVQQQRNGALLFIDLDNFKTLNETLGHRIGDLLLTQVAQRVQTRVPPDTTVARLGDDEFVVLLEGLSPGLATAATQAEKLSETLRTTLGDTYYLAGYKYRNTASIGIALFGPTHEGVEELLKRADLAMHQAKASGRNTWRFFTPEMQQTVIARAALVADLHEATLKQQFCLHYQAQVDSHNTLIGAEVLIRWQHPVRGLVSPAEFIAVAEETGLILPIGYWVLDTACQQLAHWAAQPERCHLMLAVNVSARQFHQDDFVEQVQSVLLRTGARAQRLKLELTESLLVSSVEGVIAKMTALQQLGVSFSLDDFGTGYSSLAYLKRLPLSQLKIDQGFVRNILTDSNDAAIAKMVVVLAETLNLAVIAEGVETLAQRDFLADMGCLAYQGYCFSRPLALPDFEAWAATQYQLGKRKA